MSSLFSDNVAHQKLFLQESCELEKVVLQILDALATEGCAMRYAQDYFPELDALITRLEQCIFNSSPAVHETLLSSFSQQQIMNLNAGYCAWETILEKRFAERIEAGRVTALHDYRLTSRFERLIAREISMLRNRPINNALFIGSGPVPVSAIWMHHMLQSPVDCLDIDEMAISASKAFLKNIGMENRLRVIHETSTEYDVGKYDVIVIALLAKPKKDILANISQTKRPDCQVICRTSHGLRHLLYEPTVVSREILGDFHIQEQRIINGDSDDTISSLLLEHRV